MHKQLWFACIASRS